MHSDQNFPIIDYDTNISNYHNGLIHGETFKDSIAELSKIRKELLLAKNPSLKNNLQHLSQKQMIESERFSKDLTDEIKGISIGSGIPIHDIVILNNYTDFRDITLPDEGCSTIHVKNYSNSICGQTWDMHQSAKNYVCLINIPGSDQKAGQLYFSLVGCLGMMGVSTRKLLIGVNNLNTKNARASLIWPILIRKSLMQAANFSELQHIVENAPVTSGHNYLLSSEKNGAMWEITPQGAEQVSSMSDETNVNFIVHTNHCLGKKTKDYENPISINSTTHVRYDLLLKGAAHIKNTQDMKSLLHSHENYPKSICNHFQSGENDPSATCGGGVYNLTNEELFFWRGCVKFDQNYKSYNFKIKNNCFKKVSEN